MSYFTREGPGKKHGTNKPPPTRRIQERSKEDDTCPTNLLGPPSLESVLAEQGMHLQERS